MTFVTQFNYFKKSIDSIFYSTPQNFEREQKKLLGGKDNRDSEES